MRFTLALLAATLAILPAVAAPRSGCYPVVIEGAGKVLLCAPPRKRTRHG